jgi:hypothetical protein
MKLLAKELSLKADFILLFVIDHPKAMQFLNFFRTFGDPYVLNPHLLVSFPTTLLSIEIEIVFITLQIANNPFFMEIYFPIEAFLPCKDDPLPLFHCIIHLSKEGGLFSVA